MSRERVSARALSLVTLWLVAAAVPFAASEAGASAAAAPDGPFLDWLYMEPNEGGSSAGHVAVAFGDRSYAYQRSPEGWLVLERDELEHLRWLYAVLDNRAVERSRVAVSAETFERLRDGFNRRWLIQGEERALLARLAAGERLLAVLAARAAGDDGVARDGAAAARGGIGDVGNGGRPDDDAAGVPVEAAGYFDPASDATTPALVRLRDAVAAARGRDFLATRIAALRAARAALVPAVDPAPPALRRDGYPVVQEGFADRYLAATSAIVALETLRRASPLAAAGLVTVDDPPLAAAERDALAAESERLVAALVRLAGSARTDLGFPLLVGMARLAVVERMLASGRLAVLDAFPADARRIPAAAVRRTADAARGLRDDACADLAGSRRRFAAARPASEHDWSELESAAGRCVELVRGLADARDVRVASDGFLPARTTLVTDLGEPAASPARLEVAAQAAADAHRAYVHAFAAAYGYDLVRRNCVTETFATIEAALGPDADGALGGRIAATAARTIPVLSQRAVRREWRLAAADVTPSHRRDRVAALARDGNPLLVRLRESNVLTSTIYRPSLDDSTFLFFTDDALPLRPLLGATNLAVGAGAALLGLLHAPLDRGTALERGLRGVLASLPELFFVNVRKGSFDHVAERTPPAARPSHGSPPPSPR